MKNVDLASARTADEVLRDWIGAFNRALSDKSGKTFASLFVDDGHWRDFLSLTWEFRSFEGRAALQDAFARCAPQAALSNVRLSDDRASPKHVRRSGRDLIEGYLDFDTVVGSGVGFVRIHLSEGGGHGKAWQLLTTLHSIRGFEEKVGKNRPSGEHYSKIVSSDNWLQDRERERSFANRDPEVIIVGAGHGGLMLGARLRQMGVDALLIERNARVGDNWRNRYNNLTLHNEVFANHFPYMPFPENWPVWLPKDMLAAWLEAYAEFQELNVWTSTELTRSRFDEDRREWTVVLRRGDGSEREITCKHLVAAMGISGGAAQKPSLPGLDNFKGEVVHSSEFVTGKTWAGKRALVIGTGNSGHDIAQDLFVAGAESVAIMQRGPTCVVSLEPSAAISYSIYAEGRSVEDTDLMAAAIPYPVLIETYQWITRKTTSFDREMLSGLKEAGFKTHSGADETGFQLLYLRGAGGYYIDVGCAQMIIDRKITVLQAENMDRFEEGGLRMKDGTVQPLDLVVLATGFETMQESIRRLLGNEIADRVGPIWGFDEDHNMRNMWKRTSQDGLWIMGGAITEARLFSRYLALQIKAALEGILPERESMPMVSTSTARAA